MTYADDFTDAHRRHWQDAELLFENERWANADHLYGFSAECGLKAVIEMSLATGTLDQKYRKHLPGLWQNFQSLANGLSGRDYLNLLPSGDPFAGWSVSDRYAHRCHFYSASVQPHRAAALKIRVMVQCAILDGFL